MGIFGAMTTAVSGLRAQAYGLENISGNIANSQTAGFKRVETSFVDLVPDMAYRKEVSGSVTAYSRLTNTIQGDLQSTGVSTNMALNGEGFFIVQSRSGYNTNNQPTFGGVDMYTRRGDFSLDKDGYLVNGAGLYLRGTSVDPVTGETLGSGNGVIHISSEPLGARRTTEIQYRANLPTRPGTTNMQADVDNSELLAAPPSAPPAPAPAFPAGYNPRITSLPAPAGSGFVTGSDTQRFMSESIEGGLIPVYNAVGARIDVQMRWAKVLGSAIPATQTAGVISGGVPLGGGGGNIVVNGTSIALGDGDTSAQILAKINAQSSATSVTATINGSNQLVLTSSNPGGGGSLVINGTAVALASGDTSAQLLSKINAQTGSTNVSAAIDGSGHLVLTNTNQGGGGSLVINGTSVALSSGDTSAQILSKINAQSGTTNVSASIDGSNHLVLTNSNQGGGGNLVINGTTVALASGDSQAAILSKINAQSGTTNVSASVDGSNHLVLTNSNQGGGGNLVINGTTIALASGDTSAQILSKINAQSATTNITATIDGSNHLVLTNSDNTQNVDIGAGSSAATLTELGLTSGSTLATTSGTANVSAGLTAAGNVAIGGGSTGATLTELGLAAGSNVGATSGTAVVSSGLTAAGSVAIGAGSTGATLTELGLAAGSNAGATSGTANVSSGLTAPGSVAIGVGSTGATLTELGLAAGSTVGTTNGTAVVSSGLTAAGSVAIGAGSTGVTLTELGLAAGSSVGARTGSANISTGLSAGYGGDVIINGTTIAITEGDTSAMILSKINAQMDTTGVTASLDASNRLVLTSSDNTTPIAVGGTGATLTTLGLTAGTANPTATSGETWNLFYLENGNATNNTPAWRNIGIPFTFNSSGQMTSPNDGTAKVLGLTVDGNMIGDVNFNFGTGGLTQYASADGRVQQSTLQQDGYSSGTLDSVSVTNDGRITGSYTNGRVVAVAQISIAQFQADNSLKRNDGGVYEQTLESGLPIIGLGGSTIIGSNIEGSNTDIAEEFSKMIVTQQAYSANTRVVTTSQQMLSDVLNMVR